MSHPFMLEAGVVARALNISKSTVYQLANRDSLGIPSHKFGRKVRFKRTDLEELLGAPLSEILGDDETFVPLVEEAEVIQ